MREETWQKKSGKEDEDFREVQRKKKRGNSKTQMEKEKGIHTIESQNKFQILQNEEVETKENEDEEIEGMEIIKENADKEADQVDKGQERT